MEKQVLLSWTRDKRGKVVNRHVVKIANAVTSAKRDNTQNYVAVGEQLMEIGGVCDLSYLRSGTRRSRVKNGGSITPTVMRRNDNHSLCRIEKVKRKLKIRRLTERECFRLMDVPDEVITKIQQNGVPRTWQAKLAGNSIVVNVLYCLFDRMFVHTQPIGQLLLF